MKLTFLGTRGEIEARTRRHYRHSALEVAYRGRRVMIDCGADWRRRVHELRPHAIVITHAHPDHAFGLAGGAPCPVYATAAAWRSIAAYPIGDRRELLPGRPARIHGMTFQPFTVEHSIRAPAVGYRVTAGAVTVFYAPDLVYIHERGPALAGVHVYIGDGATLTRPLVRRRDDTLIGHAPVRTQLGWCAKEGVPRAMITHCGTQIVTGDRRDIDARLRALAGERGVRAEIAYDGMVVILRGRRRAP